ncbi:MAG: hypothetical protein OXN86_02350 [Chloroflexota bacterium]|nr:hypothetical protein [Chloroflexota bacterium]
MTIDHPVDAPPAELLRLAREAAWSDDESVAADAYDCAIRAVEQAFRQIATPDNPTDDLGVILTHWEDRPDLWCERHSRVADIDTVMPVLANLWEGRPEADKAFPVFLEEARIALAISEWILKLFDLGFFELLDELTPEEEAHDQALAEQRSNEYQSGQMETRPFEEYDRERAARA